MSSYTFNVTGTLNQSDVNTVLSGYSGNFTATIGPDVTTIGNYAFYQKNVTSITISNSVTSFGDSCFRSSGLTSITIPNSVTSIDSYVFYQCSALTSITIPNSVTSIGQRVFYQCTVLTSITGNSVPDFWSPTALTSIGIYSFASCYLLKTEFHLNLANGNPGAGLTIHDYAFQSCYALTDFMCVQDGLTLDNTSTPIFKNIYSSGASASVTLNITIVSDGGSAIDVDNFATDSASVNKLNIVYLPIHFNVTGTLNQSDVNTELDGYTGIFTATIGPDVTSIGSDAFSGKNVTSITIPNNVTSIGNYTFYLCSSLTSITIPNSVTTIGTNCFRQSGLTSCTFEENSTLTTIGSNFFYQCSTLTSITIPNSVTSMYQAFFQCSALTSCTLPTNSSFTTIGGSFFYGCSSLTSVNISNNITSFSTNAFSGCSVLTSITGNSVPDIWSPTALTSIGSNCFNNCYLLETEFHLNLAGNPGGGLTIHGYAFQTCRALTVFKCIQEDLTLDNTSTPIFKSTGTGSGASVTLNINITSISGTDAIVVDNFATDSADVNKLNIVYLYIYTFNVTGTLSQGNVNTVLDGDTGDFIATIGPDVTSIGQDAFKDKNVTSVTIPNTVTSIGASAFSGTSKLTSCTLPTNANFTTIPESCFYGSGLNSITIPNTVTSIGASAFSGSGLNSITIPTSVTSIGASAFASSTNDNNNYQYVFIEAIAQRLDVAEIQIFDTGNNKISQNENWTLTTSGDNEGQMTTSNGDAFYYSESYDAHDNQWNAWQAPHIVNGSTYSANTNDGTNTGIVGNENYTRSYQQNIFNSGTSGNDIPYCVFKFNEPKQIGKIVIHTRRYQHYNNGSSSNSDSSNHNIYLANDNDISVSTRPSAAAWASAAAYTTPTIPWISGTNYKSILHFTSGVNWGTTAPESDGSGYRFDKTYDFSNLSSFNMTTIGSGGVYSNLTSCTFTATSNLTTIGDTCFYGSGLTSIAIPKSVETIGSFAFGNCYNLATAEIHRYTDDNINNEISLGSNIFDRPSSPSFTVTIHSDKNWGNTKFVTKDFQYVFYERDFTQTSGDYNPVIAEFEVWNTAGTKISHVTGVNAPTIYWSSLWDDSTTWDPSNINDSSNSSSWHARTSAPSIYDVFGNTSGTYKKSFIGYNFGSVQDIDKIVLTAYNSSTYDYRLAGTSAERAANINGYKLYFTNNVITVNTTDSSTYTPVKYFCVDPDKPYSVITSYDEDCVYVDTTNDTYTHDNIFTSSSLLRDISYNYQIIDGTTLIDNNEFKDNTFLSSITIPNSVTSIGENAFSGTSKLTSITIPNSVTTIGASAFASDNNNYQYVFIEQYVFSNNGQRLDLAEIQIYDKNHNLISQNGNWSLNTTTGAMTASNVDFYYSESYHTHGNSTWHAQFVLDGNIPTGEPSGGSFASETGLIGYTTNSNRSYQHNCFQSSTGTGTDTPYCVFQFNEPKEIGKIVIHNRRTLSDAAGTGNHNIYLVNSSDVSVATRPNNWQTNSNYVAYTTPTIPWISGTNYKSILHSTSTVDWTGGSLQFSKTYDFSNLSSFTMNTLGNGGSIGVLTSVTFPTNSSFTNIPTDCFKNSGAFNDVIIPPTVTTIEVGAFAGVTSGYLSLPINTDFNNYVTNPSSYTTRFGSNIHLLIDYFHYYKFPGSDIVKVNTGTELTFSNYKVNNVFMPGFNQGIIQEASYCDYETTNVTTLNNAFTSYPYAVVGVTTGLQVNGGDIGKRIAPYYTEYTTPSAGVTTTITLLPNWTKLGFFLIGGGGGGAGQLVTWGGGGGGGGRAFGYYTKAQLGQGDFSELILTVGGGGTQGVDGEDSIIKLGSNVNVSQFQYVFIEVPEEDYELHLSEIEIWDREGNRISQNGNWIFDSNTGAMTTTNGDAFYYSQSDGAHSAGTVNYHAKNVVNDNISGLASNTAVIGPGYGNVNRSYQHNCFQSSIGTGTVKAYCVFKFNESKIIDKIVIHCRHSNFNNSGSSYNETANHNIYLVNSSDVTLASNTNNFYPTYSTPTIPWISGTNYKSFMHSNSGVNWGTTAPESTGTPYPNGYSSQATNPYEFDKTYLLDIIIRANRGYGTTATNRTGGNYGNYGFTLGTGTELGVNGGRGKTGSTGYETTSPDWRGTGGSAVATPFQFPNCINDTNNDNTGQGGHGGWNYPTHPSPTGKNGYVAIMQYFT